MHGASPSQSAPFLIMSLTLSAATDNQTRLDTRPLEQTSRQDPTEGNNHERGQPRRMARRRGAARSSHRSGPVGARCPVQDCSTRARAAGPSAFPATLPFSWFGPVHDSIMWPWHLVPVDAPISPSWQLGWPARGDWVGECLAPAHSFNEIVTQVERTGRHPAPGVCCRATARGTLRSPRTMTGGRSSSARRCVDHASSLRPRLCFDGTNPDYLAWVVPAAGGHQPG